MNNSRSDLIRRLAACAALACSTTLPSLAAADVPVAEVNGWTISTNGRVNGFVSHVWGQSRPAGLDSLNWVGFNENTDTAEADTDNELQRTRIRSGYVPTNFAFMVSKQLMPELRALARVEIGLQITTQSPSAIGDHTWLEPRDAYLDLGGSWGSLRAGRAFGLFGRGNLFMNYELGHAYGLGFPCSYTTIFGGACGHVGFGTIYPDHRAQISYSTPKIGDVFQITAGIFDPRTLPTKSFLQTPYPRVEGEANLDYHPQEGWGFKAWANGMWQEVGTTANVTDPNTMVKERQDFSLTAYGVGAGVQGDFGPIQLGATGHMGKGMDGFQLFPFNPIYVSLAPEQPYEAEFRPTRAYLLHVAAHFTKEGWVSLGYGQSLFDRLDGDPPITTLDQAPLLRSQTGISAGVYYRVGGSVVFGVDYFRASYGFDDRHITAPPGSPEGATAAIVSSHQTVHALNAGTTLEW
jgi:predicted porin